MHKAALACFLSVLLSGCLDSGGVDSSASGGAALSECVGTQVPAGCLVFLEAPPKYVIHREATVAVDPLDPDHVVLSWTRQPGGIVVADEVTNERPQRAVVAESFDRGVTWTYEELHAVDIIHGDADSYDGSIHFLPDGRLVLVHGVGLSTANTVPSITVHMRDGLDAEWTATSLVPPYHVDAPHATVLDDGVLIVVAHSLPPSEKPMVAWRYDGEWSLPTQVTVDGVPALGFWPRLAGGDTVLLVFKQIRPSFGMVMLESMDGLTWTNLGAPVRGETNGGSYLGTPATFDAFGNPAMVLADDGVPAFAYRQDGWQPMGTRGLSETLWHSADVATAPDGTIHALLMDPDGPFIAKHLALQSDGTGSKETIWRSNDTVSGRIEYGGIDIGVDGTVWMTGVFPVDGDERVGVIRVD